MNAAMQAVSAPADQQAIVAYYEQSAVTNAKAAIDNYFSILTAGKQDPTPAKNIMNALERLLMSADEKTALTYYEQKAVTNAKAAIDNYFKVLASGKDATNAENIMDAVMPVVLAQTDKQTVQTFYQAELTAFLSNKNQRPQQ